MKYKVLLSYDGDRLKNGDVLEFEVEADSEEEAVRKVEKEWVEEHIATYIDEEVEEYDMTPKQIDTIKTCLEGWIEQNEAAINNPDLIESDKEHRDAYQAFCQTYGLEANAGCLSLGDDYYE